MQPLSSHVLVVGSGSWGTALANIFADAGHSTFIWGRDADVLTGIETKKENPKYLTGLPLSSRLQIQRNLADGIRTATLLVCAIPTQQIRAVFSPFRSELGTKTVLNASKGIETNTLSLVSQIFESINPETTYAILSGPSFAEETIKKLPTAVTIAARDEKVASEVQRMMSTPYFRAYTTHDVPGVELAGALKNVIAIASGIADGLKLGYNSQAAIINRGIAEIIRLGKHWNVDSMTFLGLAGMGDLILTCMGPLSRNRRLGQGIGQGKALKQVIQELGGVAEGYYTCRSARELGRKMGIELPIVDKAYEILYEEKSPKQALHELMSRELKAEWQ